MLLGSELLLRFNHRLRYGISDGLAVVHGEGGSKMSPSLVEARDGDNTAHQNLPRALHKIREKSLAGRRRDCGVKPQCGIHEKLVVEGLPLLGREA